VEHKQHATKWHAWCESNTVQLTQRYANEHLETSLNYHHNRGGW